MVWVRKSFVVWDELGIPNQLASLVMPTKTGGEGSSCSHGESKKALYTAKYLKEAVLFLVENCYKIIFEVLFGFDIQSLVYQSRTSHVE